MCLSHTYTDEHYNRRTDFGSLFFGHGIQLLLKGTHPFATRLLSLTRQGHLILFSWRIV